MCKPNLYQIEAYVLEIHEGNGILVTIPNCESCEEN